MSEPVTIFECPNGCGKRSLDPRDACHACRVEVRPGVTSARALQPVRYFPEGQVRPLYEACTDGSGHSIAPDDFPAPDEWRWPGA